MKKVTRTLASLQSYRESIQKEYNKSFNPVERSHLNRTLGVCDTAIEGLEAAIAELKELGAKD